MKHEITEEEYAALVILRGTGLDVVQVAMLAREALAANRGRVARVRKCLALGAQELQRQERTVSFRRAAFQTWPRGCFHGAKHPDSPVPS